MIENRNAFEDIYRKGYWGFGSGHGSLPKVTKGYRSFIEQFIVERGVKSVVDLGCGDWQFSRLIDWKGIDYLGLDIVPSVIDRNRVSFKRPGIRFEIAPANWQDLPAADLLICKDVLQHLTGETIRKFLTVLPRYRLALLTNDVSPDSQINIDIQDGQYRPLDLRRPPFELSCTELYRFHGPKEFSWKKLQFFQSWQKAVLMWARP
jgi:SAM-dependent methyltransferase